MTGRSDFTDAEWTDVLQGPPSAGMIIITAAKGGTFRESFAIGKAYAEARKQHSASQLLDEVVAAKPEMDRTRHSSYEELREAGLGRLRDATSAAEVKRDGASTLKASFARVKQDATAAVNQAKSDFSSQTKALASSVATLSITVTSLPTPRAIAELPGHVSGVATAAKNLHSAVSSKCG